MRNSIEYKMVHNLESTVILREGFQTRMGTYQKELLNLEWDLIQHAVASSLFHYLLTKLIFRLMNFNEFLQKLSLTVLPFLWRRLRRSCVTEDEVFGGQIWPVPKHGATSRLSPPTS